MSETATTKPVSGVTAWYALPVGEAAKQLSANTQSGLNESEAAQRLQPPHCAYSRWPEGWGFNRAMRLGSG
jgi:cation transport ATPase-like protein